jgi:hypothetical protein
VPARRVSTSHSASRSLSSGGGGGVTAEPGGGGQFGRRVPLQPAKGPRSPALRVRFHPLFRRLAHGTHHEPCPCYGPFEANNLSRWASRLRRLSSGSTGGITNSLTLEGQRGGLPSRRSGCRRAARVAVAPGALTGWRADAQRFRRTPSPGFAGSSPEGAVWLCFSGRVLCGAGLSFSLGGDAPEGQRGFYAVVARQQGIRDDSAVRAALGRSLRGARAGMRSSGALGLPGRIARAVVERRRWCPGGRSLAPPAIWRTA